MIIFTVIGLIIVGLILVSFFIGLAGKSATPILDIIDRAAGINNQTKIETTAKDLFENLQPKINAAILKFEDTNSWHDISENSMILAKLFLYSEKLQVEMSAEEAGKFYLAKTFSELFDRDDFKLNHKRKTENISAFIEGNYRDGIKMEFIVKNAKELCENYVRKYAQAAYKNQTLDSI
jgi:hypothetical protein